MRNKLLIIIVLILAILTNSGCKTEKITYVSTQSVQVKNISYPDATLQIELRLHNPNRFKFTISEIESNLMMNHVAMGKITLDKSVNVPKQSDFILPIQLKVGMGKALQQAIQLLGHAGTEPIFISIKGNAHFQKKQIPIHYPIDFEGYQTVKFK